MECIQLPVGGWNHLECCKILRKNSTMSSAPTGSWIWSRLRRDRIQLPVGVEDIVEFCQSLGRSNAVGLYIPPPHQAPSRTKIASEPVLDKQSFALSISKIFSTCYRYLRLDQCCTIWRIRDLSKYFSCAILVSVPSAFRELFMNFTKFPAKFTPTKP